LSTHSRDVADGFPGIGHQDFERSHRRRSASSVPMPSISRPVREPHTAAGKPGAISGHALAAAVIDEIETPHTAASASPPPTDPTVVPDPHTHRARTRCDRAPTEEGGGGFGSRLSGHSAGRCSRVPEPVWARSGGSDQSRQTTPVPGGGHGAGGGARPHAHAGLRSFGPASKN